jgi:hypothetical protein
MSPRSIERAYIFAISSIIFGLPLGISYYVIQSDWRFGIEFAALYLIISMIISFTILLSGKSIDNMTYPATSQAKKSNRTYLEYLSLILATLAIFCFSVMRYILVESYPYPSLIANTLGGLYITFLSIAAAIGIPLAVTRGISIVKKAMEDRFLIRIAIVTAIAYFLTYEILVNEIVITGFNVPPYSYVPSPSGTYPWVYVFTGGPSPSNPLESLVYIPYVLIQLNPIFNFFFVPFEILFAITLSTLMGAGTAAVLYSIRRSASIGAACRRGAVLSGLGGFIGYTATCPSCLAPTLISAILGGFSIAQQAYTNIYGVIIPPVVSLAALSFNLVFLNRIVGREQVSKASTDSLQGSRATI